MKKIGTYLLAVTLLLSLVACAPKRYERKHAPVGSSSVKKSSGETQEKEKREDHYKKILKDAYFYGKVVLSLSEVEKKRHVSVGIAV